MFYSTRSKLLASFLGVTLLVGAGSLFNGVHLIDQNVFGEAMNRVRQDLNGAHEIYQTRVKQVKISLSITTLGFAFISSVSGRNTTDLAIRLERMARLAELDFAGVITEEGRTLCRLGPYAFPGAAASRGANPIAKVVLEQRVAVAGTILLDRDFLLSENPDLADRARIALALRPEGDPGSAGEESAGMAIAAAVPIFDGETLGGVIYGGVLLNRSEAIVDTVRETVFQGETYQGRSVGSSPIYLNDVRISTNVYGPEGRRAVGTRALPDVKAHVLDQGKFWTNRAHIVNDWYITAYRSI